MQCKLLSYHPSCSSLSKTAEEDAKMMIDPPKIDRKGGAFEGLLSFQWSLSMWHRRGDYMDREGKTERGI